MGVGSSTTADTDAARKGATSTRTSTSPSPPVQRVTAPLRPHGKATPPPPTTITISRYDPARHRILAAKGVGIVVSGAQLRCHSTHGLPPPPQQQPSSTSSAVASSHHTAHATDVGSGGSGQFYRWFVEDLDRMGRWEPYSSESSARLEAAFMARKPSCLVTLKKRAYTVDLHAMIQGGSDSTNNNITAGGGGGAAGRVRQVRRALARTLPSGGGSESAAVIEMVMEAMADPFDGNEGNANTNDSSHDDENNDHTAATAAPGGSNNSNSNYQSNNDGGGDLPRLTCLAYPSALPMYSLDITPVGESRGIAGNDGGGGFNIISGGKDGRLVEWNAATGTVLTRYAITASKPTCVLAARYSGGSSSPSTARLIACGCDDTVARLYCVGVPSPVHLLKGHTHKVYGVSVSSDNERVFTGSMDAHVKEWDVETGACTRSEHCHTSHVFSLVASRHNPDFCLSAGNDAILCAHDFRCGGGGASSVVMRLKGHTSTIWDCGIFPGEGGENIQLASAGMDATVRLWDPRRPDAALHVHRNHSRPVHSIAYTPSGRAIVSGGKDSFVFCTDTTATTTSTTMDGDEEGGGVVLWRAKAQTSSVFRVLCSRDGRVLVTSGVSGLVNQWEWSMGETL